MSLVTSILSGGANSHTTTSEEVNYHATDFFSDGVVGSYGNTGGVAPATGNFAVNAQGTPDMTVAVSSGAAYVAGTPAAGNSQRFRVKNSASANVTIAANSTGGTRYDWLYIKIDPTAAANPAADASDVASLVTSRSTSNTIDNGTPPTYKLLLAVVTVANGASSITNGNIADSRTQTGATSTTYSNYFALNNFVESGCVWSGDAYASTLNASMTSGFVWIAGSRLTVAAVTAHAFTASKDTYVDLKDNGDGTASINYTEATTNAASSALYGSGTTSDTVRVAIIVSGASSIAAVGSVNQGQETKVLPIASSAPYTTTDSLGNLICPRDPSRKLLGYKKWTAAATTASTSTVAIAGFTCPVIVPAGRRVKITCVGAIENNTINDLVVLSVLDGSTVLGETYAKMGVAAMSNPAIAVGFQTPSQTTDTSKTYNAGLRVITGGTARLNADTTAAHLFVEFV